ncbi:hypothetical protein KGM_200513 [Danaus plexippus plexippus]|uniref:Uncharacterized protein n=1 Tax=Danaus plexippus plexippus TaxID=278856 RepID=A0A212EVB7_DANPL|nr:uncharacterized protein LOC116778514 [Danaus plexippus plexippus]OWR45435.1 hypothetical protein KGM_200513 [Danaus plexippus plexippus]
MGKDEKEDTGFGFKDRAKAEETLRLLEAHEPNYRRLTVRGLLGRAKRVLSLTKAEDKIKNIKEAMKVFEDWLAELELNKPGKEEKEDKKRKRSEEKDSSSDVEMEDNSKEKKGEKKEKEKKESADTVPGLGFKDKEAAENTLKQLEGRDPDYQQLAIKGLIRSAKRVLTCTRDETKLANIKNSIEIFEKFLEDFEREHRSKQNNTYISLGLVETSLDLAGDRVSEQQRAFIEAYRSVEGQYKRLRTVRGEEDITWDIIRNRVLAEMKDKYADVKLFDEEDKPTPEHLDMLLWAYSPERERVRKLMREKETGENRENGESPNKKMRTE